MFYKKILLIAFVLLPASSIVAQGLGVQAGFIQNTTREKISTDEKYTPNPTLNGFKVGVFYEHDFYKGLGISYGLNYSFLSDQTPWTPRPNSYGIEDAEKTQTQYIDLPIGLQYKVSIAQELFLVFNVGPTLSYGLTNKTLAKERSIVYEKETPINRYASGYTDKFQRFNLMMGGSIGIQYKQYQIRGGYDWGLLNLYDTEYISNATESYTRYARRNEWNVKLIYNF